MTDLRIKELQTLMADDRDVRSMCRTVMVAEGATSVQMLLDVAPEVFADLVETARELSSLATEDG